MRLKGSLQISKDLELIKVESTPTFIEEFAILTCTIRLFVDRTPFIASVNFGNYRWGAWRPNDVWVKVEPDKNDGEIKARIGRATSQATLRGFKPSPIDFFIHTCRKCRKRSVTAKFSEALLLPENTEIDLAATVMLAKRRGEAKLVHDLCVIPQETYDLCLLHGPNVRYDEELF